MELRGKRLLRGGVSNDPRYVEIAKRWRHHDLGWWLRVRDAHQGDSATNQCEGDGLAGAFAGNLQRHARRKLPVGLAAHGQHASARSRRLTVDLVDAVAQFESAAIGGRAGRNGDDNAARHRRQESESGVLTLGLCGRFRRPNKRRVLVSQRLHRFGDDRMGIADRQCQ